MIAYYIKCNVCSFVRGLSHSELHLHQCVCNTPGYSCMSCTWGWKVNQMLRWPYIAELRWSMKNDGSSFRYRNFFVMKVWGSCIFGEPTVENLPEQTRVNFLLKYSHKRDPEETHCVCIFFLVTSMSRLLEKPIEKVNSYCRLNVEKGIGFNRRVSRIVKQP